MYENKEGSCSHFVEQDWLSASSSKLSNPTMINSLKCSRSANFEPTALPTLSIVRSETYAIALVG